MNNSVISLILLTLLFAWNKVSAQKLKNKDVLLSFVDEVTEEYGYKNLKGDIVIPAGKYTFCISDTFSTFAIVATTNKGIVAIDRQEQILYEVFTLDNGPDYVSDGLFRVMIDKKIGYGSAKTGKIIIQPQFDCAWPFENGKAQVSINCTKQSDGEHSTWLSNDWFYIDKTGKKVKSPKTKATR